MARYDGKTVLITGGASGIGLTTARMLVAEGARVLLTGRTQATLDAAKSELGDAATVLRSDAASLDDIKELAAFTRAEFGELDVLFLNAGVTRWTPFESIEEEQYDEIFAINAKGPYFTVQQLAPVLKDGGAVVLTTSVVNVLGFPLVSAYGPARQRCARWPARSHASCCREASG